MITKFEISNYKSIKSLALDMKPFMVLVGPNGAGKTNVVRAIELLGRILQRGSTSPVREEGWGQIIHREKKPARGGLRLGATIRVPLASVQYPRTTRDLELVDVCVEVTMRGTLSKSEIEVVEEKLRVTSNRGTLDIGRKGVNANVDLGDDERLWADFGGFSPGRKPDGRKIRDLLQAQLALGPDQPEALVVLAASPFFHATRWDLSMSRIRLDASGLRSEKRLGTHEMARLGPGGEGLAVIVDQMRGSELAPSERFGPVLKALQEVYPRIEDVRPEHFGGGRVTLNFHERGIKEPIPLDGVSDGVLHALAILVALAVNAPGILAVEEPENAIHPWSIRKILERAQRTTRRQVLLTTHSETVVNAVQDPENLFIVEGDEHTGTTVTPATSKEEALAAILRETGQGLGDVWMDGSLGGVPQ